MPVNITTRLRSGQHEIVCFDTLYGGHDSMDGYHDVPFSMHSRQSSATAWSRPSSIDMASSPASVTTPPTSSATGSRIGRPPQWTVSRSRKLARLYLYSTLSIERIIKVLEGNGFNPRKNSAQKTIHKMLDNDPRYLRPESRAEMTKRINSLALSRTRRRKRKRGSGDDTTMNHGVRESDYVLPRSEATSPSGQSIKTEDAPTFDFTASPDLSNPPCSYFGIPPRSQELAESSDDPNAAEVQDIKRRVSDCSTHYAFELSGLIREFTISVCSDELSSGRRLSTALSEASESGVSPDFERVPEPYESFPDPGFAVPGDFLTAHTRSCADFPGQQHGKGDCWCSVARETSADPKSWLLPNGELSERGRRVLEHASPSNFSVRDGFGNTRLHLFAALEGYRETLLGMVASGGDSCLRAVNTAGQTFLHVLHLEWFADVADPSTPLRRLLAHLRDCCPDLVYETDVYGRTFFHRAQSLIRDPSLLASLVGLFDPTVASRRDAFGFNPVTDTDPTSHSPYIPPRRIGSVSPQEDFSRASPSSRPPSSSEGSFLAYHARLVQVIQSSYTNPTIEDAEGRNGLHCLAEAILNQQAMDRHVRSSSSSSAGSRPHLKRKLDSADSTSVLPPAPTSSPSPSGTSSAPSPEGPLPTRLRHLHSLLHPSVSVSVTHYDRRGYTPLMAFIEHIPDDQDDKSKTLQTILETLIRAGARIEAKNRRGETPLLVAARLGRKVALAVLLDMGANVHARDVDGKGVLEVIDAEVGGVRARGEVGLYARLEACRVLLTGRKEWGVAYVTRGGGGDGVGNGRMGEGAVVREWRVRM